MILLTAIDVCGALISDGTENTLLQPLSWLPTGATDDDAEALFCSSATPDMYANFAVYLCAKACELISDRNKYIDLDAENACDAQRFQSRWMRLWEQLAEWSLNRPPEMQAVESINTTPFPHIFFAHWAAISSNQLYHTSCVLLLNANRRHKVLLPQTFTTSTMWHVKRICGISLANPHEGCLNNAIQPLWIAGRLLTHSTEQALVVKTIQHIEVLTGWTATWRIHDLESTWGYKIRGET